jgi:hypothetical protein
MSDAKPHGSGTSLPPRREASPHPGETPPLGVWEDAIRHP